MALQVSLVWMHPQARHTRLLEAVPVERLAMVELLQDLVRTPSVGGTRGESELQKRLARDFAAAGLETDLWPLPLAELERAPDFPGVEVARQDAFGLVGRLKGTSGGTTSWRASKVKRTAGLAAT